MGFSFFENQGRSFFFFLSVSYTEVPCRASFEEGPCLLNDVCKTLGQSTIFPCVSGLEIEAQKGGVTNPRLKNWLVNNPGIDLVF